MKLCIVMGDLTSDEADVNYPRGNVCNECLVSEKAKIVTVEGWPDKLFGTLCYFCKKSKIQEDEDAQYLRFRH